MRAEHLETTRRRKDGSIGRGIDHRVDVEGRRRQARRAFGDRPGHHRTRRARSASCGQHCGAWRRRSGSRHLGSFEFDVATGDVIVVGRVLPHPRHRPRSAGEPATVHPAVHPDDSGQSLEVWETRSERAFRFDASSASSAPTRRSAGCASAPCPMSRDDGTVEKLAGTMMDETERVAGRSRATRRRDPLRDRIRTVGDRRGDRRSRRHPDTRQPGGVPVLRAAGGAAGRHALDRVHPSRRGTARAGRPRRGSPPDTTPTPTSVATCGPTAASSGR